MCRLFGNDLHYKAGLTRTVFSEEVFDNAFEM